MSNSGAVMAMLAVGLVPQASQGILMPPVASPMQELSSSSSSSWKFRSSRSWGCALFSKRSPLDCCSSSTTMQSPGPNNPNGPRRRGPSAGTAFGAGAHYVSRWFSAATSYAPSLTLQASKTPFDRLGGWFTGGFRNGDGGGNGTDSSLPSGGPMGDGEGVEGGVRIELGYGQREGGVVKYVPAPNSTRIAPWLWLSALWGLYAVWLRQSPLVTKALTAGVLALGGDLMAQSFEFQQSGGRGPLLKDTRRLLAVVIDSVLITGPALHALYGVLEILIPTSGGGMIPALCHLMLDTFVFDPVFVASFFCVTGLLENRPLKTDILPSLRREYWPAVRGAWAVSFLFSPVNYVTFRYLPLEFRVLSVNVCDIVWTSVLSYFSHKAVSGVAHAADVAEKLPPNFEDSNSVLDAR